MAQDEPTPKMKAFPLSFEAPASFGRAALWVAIVMDEQGRTFLNAPLDTHPEASLALVGEAASLVCQAAAQRLRSALLAERVMQAPEEEPALTQGRA